MNTLYFVRLYNHRLNQWTRFLLTRADADSAAQDALGSLGPDWAVRSSTAICTTPDEVSQEV